MLAILRSVPQTVGKVLLVGHNPELQTFALDLIGSGPRHLKDRLEAKLPTGGLVVLRFLMGTWKTLEMNSGKLELFLTPKEAGPG
jgi:phosphohistidine phosphatase